MFKHRMDLNFHRRLTWKERLKALAGFNLDITLQVMTEHKPGKFEPSLHIEFTEVILPSQIQGVEYEFAPNTRIPAITPETACNTHTQDSNPGKAGTSDRADCKSGSSCSREAISDAKRDERHRALNRHQGCEGSSGPCSKP